MNNPEELLRTIENHPLTQKIIEEKEAETLAKRKDAVQRMAEATAELEAMPWAKKKGLSFFCLTP